jgi:virulence factor Mce-like protein
VRRRRGPSPGANPVLIGAATVLIVLVAVFLAYNANNGLPFVPTYELKVNVPDAAQLVVGNDVRIGGQRVGVVSDIKPLVHRTGAVSALLTLKLQTSIQPLPTDSTMLVRPRSALGLKYVEITRGSARSGFPDGARVPLANATPKPVELDQVLNTFDAPTRQASRRNLLELGTGVAGRGVDLNTALQSLDPLVRALEPVMRNLADPTTRLGPLFVDLERVAAIVAPAADAQGRMFANLDTTFAALARVARPYIQDAISGGPQALDTATHSFVVERPFLDNTTGLLRELRPGAAALGSSAPALADALGAGTVTLRRVGPLNDRLASALKALERFVSDPLVPLGVRGLRDAATTLRGPIAFLTPVQTTCNYMTLWFRNVASLLSEGDANGTWERFIIIVTPAGPNSEGTPSSAPANGPTPDNHLHVNPYPNAASPGQTQECEAANERYLTGKTVIGNVPGNQGTLHDVTKSSLTK